jgi:outer membrane receptor for ferrienterochelin and colicin
MTIQQKKELPLKEALQLISREWNIQFAYESALVEHIIVQYDWSAMRNTTPEKLLHHILQPSRLSFIRISNNYFTIVKEKKKSSIQLIAAMDTVPVITTGVTILEGRVTVRKDGSPVPVASISLSQLGLYTMTDANGVFTFSGVPEGNWRLNIQHLTMEPVEISTTVLGGRQNKLVVQMEETQLSLREIQVVAVESKGGQATASKISQSAIEHLQATSLADVLQLLPGVPAQNPDLSTVNKFAIRQVGVNNMGSLGTAVMVNGVPVSNNANLQATNPAAAGANASFATTTGSGIDLRQVSADNIESIEVIRGVPSVEYGDLTAGAILVKTKAGKSPLQLKTRINPKLTQFWMGQGLALGPRAGSLNVDIDYTNATSDQRFEVNGYKRITTTLLHSVKLFQHKPLFATTGFSYGMNLDDRKQDPDDISRKIANRAQNYSFHLHTTGRWNLQYKYARMLTYMLSADYAIQKGYQQQQVGGASVPIITAMKDTTMESQYAPSDYLSRMWIEGRPLNLLAKVTNTFYGYTGTFRHRILMGTEWKMDVNKGPGKTYDLSRPPNPAADGNASRPRAYSDVPAMHQIAAYIEDNLSVKLLQRDLLLQVGLRYDHIMVKEAVNTALSPRINLGYDLTKSFTLRAGYGLTAKAPSLLYLYPQEAYFDMKNLDYYAQNAAERLLITTTRVYNAANPQLKMAVNHKKELGFDWRFSDNRRFTVTAYHEHLKNGYNFNTTLRTVKIMALEIDTIGARPAGQQPEVVKLRTDNRFADYNEPTNDVEIINKGIEFDLDLGRFEPIRTSFVLNGALMNTRTTSTGNYLLKMAPLVARNVDPDKLAIFAPGRGSTDERFTTTLRMIHHIPALRFIVTLSAQTIWISKNKYLGYDSIPIGYIQRSDGAAIWLDATERSKITRNDRELFMNISQEYYQEESWKPLFLFNLRLTKEIGRHVGFSFYANNVTMSNPLQESNRWRGQFTRRNLPLFFGSEIKFSF